MTPEQYLTKPYSNENQFTAYTHTFINHNYPQLRGFYFHVPNENQHNLTALGILAGVPDFCFIAPYTFFIELKMPKGNLSPNQKKLHERWTSAGIKVFTAYNPQQVKNILSIVFCNQ